MSESKESKRKREVIVMNKVTTDVKHVEIDGKHLVAQFEVINANEDEYEVSLMSPFVEGGFVDGKIGLSAIVDAVGYGLRDRDQEIVVECELEVESDADAIESDEFRFDAARNGSLSTDTLPQLTQRETVLCLGEDLQVILTFAYK